MNEKQREYREYLLSPHWKRKRAQRLAIDKHLCWCCSEPATQVHHITYVRRGDERMDDLISICQRCHSALHELVTKRKAPLGVAHKRIRLYWHPEPGKKAKRKKPNKRPKKDPIAKARAKALRDARHRCVCCTGSTNKTYDYDIRNVPMCSECLGILDVMKDRYEGADLVRKVKYMTGLTHGVRKKLLSLLEEGS